MVLTGSPEREQDNLASIADRQGGFKEREAVHGLADIAVDTVYAALTGGAPQQEAVRN